MGEKSSYPEKSNDGLSFSVSSGKEHVVFNNINSHEIGVIKIMNKSTSVMRVLIYDDCNRGPETVGLAASCGGVYCGNKIVIRTKESPLSGVMALLHVS